MREQKQPPLQLLASDRHNIALGVVAAFVLAACTVGIFNGLVRTADSIGIPVDRGMVGRTADFRQDLGLNHFSGSRNTELSNEVTDTGPTAIPDLFGN